MEKMINNRFKDYIEKHNLYDPMQLGFRAKRGSVNLSNNLHAAGSQTTSLHEKAFNRLWIYKILT